MSGLEALLAANNIADKKARQDRYAEILEQLISGSDIEGLKCFIEQGAFILSLQRLPHSEDAQPPHADASKTIV